MRPRTTAEKINDTVEGFLDGITGGLNRRWRHWLGGYQAYEVDESSAYYIGGYATGAVTLVALSIYATAGTGTGPAIAAAYTTTVGGISVTLAGYHIATGQATKWDYIEVVLALPGAVGGAFKLGKTAVHWGKAAATSGRLFSNGWKSIADEFATFTTAQATTRMRQFIKDTYKITPPRITVLNKPEFLKLAGGKSGRAGFTALDKMGNPVVVLLNREFGKMVGTMRHEMVHVNQAIHHLLIYRWGTTAFAPGSSIVLFGLEVPAYATEFAGFAKYSKAFWNVYSSPTYWASDLLYVGAGTGIGVYLATR